MAGKLCAPLCQVGFGYLCVFTPLPTLTRLNVCLPRCLVRCLKSSTSTMRLQHGHRQQTVRWCFSDFQCNSPVDQGSDGGESNRSCCWWRDGAGAARCPVTKTASVAAADLRVARAQSGRFPLLWRHSSICSLQQQKMKKAIVRLLTAAAAGGKCTCDIDRFKYSILLGYRSRKSPPPPQLLVSLLI